MPVLPVLWLALILLSGCATSAPPMPDAGQATYHKTTAADGTIKESLTVAAPQQGSGATTVQAGALQISFASSHKWEMPTMPNATPQNMMYGVGLTCILIGVGFVGIGRHFKLGALSGIAGVSIIGLAVTIDKMGEQIALVASIILLLLAAFVGWMLWLDYKDDGRINMSNLK